jgi:hypothetical protein
MLDYVILCIMREAKCFSTQKLNSRRKKMFEQDHTTPGRCVICGSSPLFQIDNTKPQNDTCKVCFKFLAATSPLMCETTLYHYKRLLDQQFDNMRKYLQQNYNEYEDESYLETLSKDSVFRLITPH